MYFQLQSISWGESIYPCPMRSVGSWVFFIQLLPSQVKMRNKIKMPMDNPVARVANIVVVQCPYLSTKPTTTTNNVWLLLIELKFCLLSKNLQVSIAIILFMKIVRNSCYLFEAEEFHFEKRLIFRWIFIYFNVLVSYFIIIIPSSQRSTLSFSLSYFISLQNVNICFCCCCCCCLVQLHYR